ncbi:envoplakin-like [Scleropages formosus]|uniref:Envoplakin-like n=1 Tax=Scleropages formosus TaxID=113540 RepID=A0A0P7US58_SCLFO|nr:envoplakin-like [Scleropages formosus]
MWSFEEKCVLFERGSPQFVVKALLITSEISFMSPFVTPRVRIIGGHVGQFPELPVRTNELCTYWSLARASKECHISGERGRDVWTELKRARERGTQQPKMLKKKDSYTVNDPSRITRAEANDLSVLIARMQRNADLMEKDILDAEEKMALDSDNATKGLSFQSQRTTKALLADAERLLDGLFQDLEKAKSMKHPQANEIEHDIHNLQDRWQKDCDIHSEVYKQLKGTKVSTKANWPVMLKQKQMQVDTGEYGPSVPDIEKQIASHNILQKEIEAYGPVLDSQATSTPEESDTINKQYKNLLESSRQRGLHLSSLYDYLLGCTKEVAYLRKQQDKVLQQDWSDRSASLLDVCQLDENFKESSLRSHEREARKLQDDADRLVRSGHPASAIVKADVETLSDSLRRLRSSLDLATLGSQTNAEADEALLQQTEQLLADLKMRSKSIPPLHLRRCVPGEPTAVEALSDWKDAKARSHSSPLHRPPPMGPCTFITDKQLKMLQHSYVSITQGERFTLRSNSDPESWSVQTISGATMTVPGACLLIPPPDPQTIDKVGRLEKEIADLRKRREAAQSSQKSGTVEVTQTQRSVPVSTTFDDSKAGGLASKLDRVDSDLTQVKRDILSRLRAPLDRKDPVCDLIERLEKQVNADLVIRNLDQEIAAVQRETDLLSSAKPGDPAINSLRLKLNSIKNKQSDIATLADLYTKKDLNGKQREVQQLSRDLEPVKQVCSSLQAGYQEYCPDLCRQEAEVRRLQKRYDNIEFQLQTSAIQSLNLFLNNLPNNEISPSDSLSQVNTKMNSQKEYDANCDKYRSIVDEGGNISPKKQHASSMLQSVQERERALHKRFSEVSAENEQLLSQMGYAKNLVAQTEDRATQVVVQQHLQLQSQQRGMDEVDGLKQELAAETTRRTRTEDELDSFQRRMISLKSRRGVERVEEKEVLQYYRDPKLESSLELMRSKIHDEALKQSSTKAEVEVINKKIVVLENEVKNVTPKLVTKVVTEIERDPKLDITASKMREELQKLKEEIRIKASETINMKTEISILEQKRPPIKEKVVKKEVVQLERDPEMQRAIASFQADIAKETERCKYLNDEIFSTRREINTLERIIPTVMPRIITKEVKSVERDPELINESKRLSTLSEEEKALNNALIEEIAKLQLSYAQVQNFKPKIEVKETINEIYRIDPETEVQLLRMKKELQESSKQRISVEQEIKMLMMELEALRSQKPKVELKELTREVVKEERSPEIMKEMQRLNDQLSSLQSTFDSTLECLTSLRKERDEWKAKNSKVETKVVTKEVIRYENDPLLEKEAERLRKEVREETQRRRAIEETVFDLQHMYLQLENQKPEERVVVKEVVRLQRDPTQILEHDKLSRSIDEEVKSRRKLELEVEKLRAVVKEKETSLGQTEERQKKIKVEMELRQIRARITELESTPTPITEKVVVEEVMKVERSPEMEKMIDNLHGEMDRESNHVLRLEKEIQNLKVKLEILEREKTTEKTVYKEVIRVERDEAVEAERARLREQVSNKKNERRDLEDDIQLLNSKLTRLQNSKKGTSREKASLVQSHEPLQKESESLLNELRKLELRKQEITITFHQQSQLLSEQNQQNKRKSIMMEAEVQHLENDILEEKNKIHKRENYIIELQNSLKEATSEVRETNRSTRITILDPETGKDMSPYDAYLEGLIDRNHYIHLQELECSWEEVTSTDPQGERTVLQDRKSGKQYSFRSALKAGRVSNRDIQRYRDGKIPIAEFALMIAGETKTKIPLQAEPKTSVSSSSTSLSSSATVSGQEECFPISGVIDTTTNNRMSVRSALTRNLIDPDTALKLLEAQAATGGIVDITNNIRYSVHKAAMNGLIDRALLKQLLNAQKAFTGIEDSSSKNRLSLGDAVQKGLMPRDIAFRFMEAQVLTGGLVDPNRAGRMSVEDALKIGMIDSATAEALKDESKSAKDLVDPITKKKISYKEAMVRCKKEPSTELLMLPVACTETDAAPSYSSRSRSSSYGYF